MLLVSAGSLNSWFKVPLDECCVSHLNMLEVYCGTGLALTRRQKAQNNALLLVICFGNERERTCFFLFIQETRTDKSRLHYLWHALLKEALRHNLMS